MGAEPSLATPWSLLLPPPLFVPTLARQRQQSLQLYLPTFPGFSRNCQQIHYNYIDGLEASAVQNLEQNHPTGINTESTPSLSSPCSPISRRGSRLCCLLKASMKLQLPYILQSELAAPWPRGPSLLGRHRASPKASEPPLGLRKLNSHLRSVPSTS